MKIAVDTREDSREEILHVIELLKRVINNQNSQPPLNESTQPSQPYSEMINNPPTPEERSANNIFGNNPVFTQEASNPLPQQPHQNTSQNVPQHTQIEPIQPASAPTVHELLAETSTDDSNKEQDQNSLPLINF